MALESGRLFERLLNPAEGLYPKIGNITPGSGFSIGPGYRQPACFGGHADFSTFAVDVVHEVLDDRRAAAVAATRERPGVRRRRARAALRLSGRGLLRSRSGFAPRERSHLRPAEHRSSAATGTFARRRGSPSGAASSTSHRGQGRDRRRRRSSASSIRPSCLARWRNRTSSDTRRRSTSTRVSRAAIPRQGGRYALTYQRFDDLDRGRSRFDRVEVDLQQYISLLRDRRVLALRALVSTSDADAGAGGSVLFPAHARRSRRPPRLPTSSASATGTFCCSRPSTAGRSSRRWTARSSTTPARSRHAREDLDLQRPRVRLRHRLPVRHDRTACFSASRARSAAAAARTSSSGSAMSSEHVGAAFRRPWAG